MELLCSKCNTIKDESLFWSAGKNVAPKRNGKHNHCSECKRNLDIERISKNPELHYFRSILKASSYRNREFNLDIDFLLQLYKDQKGLCALSKIKMKTLLYVGHDNYNCSIDRIDNNKGYTKDNIRLVCSIVNKMKLNMTDSELFLICSNIINNESQN